MIEDDPPPPDPELERLLGFAREELPEPGAAERSWQIVSERIRHGPGPSGSGSAGPTGLGGSTLITVVVVGVLALGVFAGLQWARRPSPASPPASLVNVDPDQPGAASPADPIQASLADSPRAPTPPVITPEPTPPREQLAAPVASAPREEHGLRSGARAGGGSSEPTTTVAEPASSCDLASEAQLLATIQLKLQAKQGEAALAAVGRWRKECRDPSLAEEVRALELLAMCELGRVERARREAKRFAAKWPRSTLENRLVSSCVGDVFTASREDR